MIVRFIQSEDLDITGNDKEVWFPAKTYGWGWGFPITWQGWVTFIAYLALLFGGSFIAKSNAALFSVAFALYVIGITAVLIGICWSKGEKLSWHWGR